MHVVRMVTEGKGRYMFNYKITLQYDGTGIQGWQKQTRTQNTIQGKLEAILTKMTGVQTEVHGAGRTDAGVHAYGQTANFKLREAIPEQKILSYLNRYLPRQIAVTEICQVPESFHSRLSAKSKVYLYRIWNGPYSPVFERNFLYHIPEPLAVAPMRTAAAFFMGEHDFRSFSADRRSKKSTIRTLFHTEIQTLSAPLGTEVRIILHGSGFLYHMARIITGTLIEAGFGLRASEEIPALFACRDRSKAGFTAPPQGLILQEVRYENESIL